MVSGSEYTSGQLYCEIWRKLTCIGIRAGHLLKILRECARAQHCTYATIPGSHPSASSLASCRFVLLCCTRLCCTRGI